MAEAEAAAAGRSVWARATALGWQALVLVAICGVSWPIFYDYDVPAALKQRLQAHYDLSAVQYELLYSVYNVPNVLLPFFGGYLMDRVLGLRAGSMVTALLCFGGQLLFAYSALLVNPLAFYFALAGRFLLGLGGDLSSVAKNAYVGTWFPANSLAMTLTISLMRLGNAATFTVNPFLAQRIGLTATLWTSVLPCALSVVSTVALGLYSWLLERRGDSRVPRVRVESVSLLRALRFGPEVLLLAASTCGLYLSLFIFTTFASDYFVFRFGLSEELAGFSVSLLFYVTVVGSPLAGLLLFYTGRYIIWLAVGMALVLAGQLALALLAVAWLPLLVMPLFGAAYAISSAAIWPVIPALVDADQLATAFGFLLCVNNVGFVLLPIAAGLLLDGGRFAAAMWLMVALAAFGLLSTVALFVCDARRLRILNASGARVRQFVRAKFAAASDQPPIAAVDSAPTAESASAIAIELSETSAPPAAAAAAERPDE